jgi:hypothetical protein
MSVAMSLLAILEEAPTYGLRLKNEFESRTGTMWPLNVGQVYSTLGLKGANTPIRHATAAYSWMRPPRRSWRLSFTADPWSEGTE